MVWGRKEDGSALPEVDCWWSTSPSHDPSLGPWLSPFRLWLLDALSASLRGTRVAFNDSEFQVEQHLSIQSSAASHSFPLSRRHSAWQQQSSHQRGHHRHRWTSMVLTGTTRSTWPWSR